MNDCNDPAKKVGLDRRILCVYFRDLSVLSGILTSGKNKDH